MSLRSIAVVALSGLVVLTACAQQEEPAYIAPEPVYNKFGAVETASCRPAGQTVNSTFPASLPPCEPPPGCPPGTQTVAGAAPTYCVPIQREGDGQPTGGRNPNNPAAGIR